MDHHQTGRRSTTRSRAQGLTLVELSPEHRRWRWRLLSADGPASPVQRLVAVVLFDFYATSPDGRIFPSLATIAEKVGTSERTVRVAVAGLVAGGWVSVTERPGTGGQGWRRHAYELCWPRGFDWKADPWLKDVKARKAAGREAFREENGYGEYR